MSEPRKFIVSERPNGLGLSVMNHGATYSQSPDRTYYSVIETSAVAELQDRINEQNLAAMKQMLRVQELERALKNAQETVLAVAGKATDRGTQRFLIGEYNEMKAVLEKK